jgi:hypothetical protein
MNRKLLLFLFTEMLTDVGRIYTRARARASDKSAIKILFPYVRTENKWKNVFN